MKRGTDWHARILRGRGCWRWVGKHSKSGYAEATLRLPDGTRQYWRVHKLTYTEKHGPVPTGLVLDHFRCDNRWCVNPDHVRPVTQRENALRSPHRHVLVTPEMRCGRGHDLCDGNLGVRPDGYAKCLACHREWTAEWRARKRAAVEAA